MFKRLQRYIRYKFVAYIPGTSKIVEMEAKRLSSYIFDNYNENEQLTMLELLKTQFIDYRETQIKNKELLLLQEEINLKNLKVNLDKLKNLN